MTLVSVMYIVVLTSQHLVISAINWPCCLNGALQASGANLLARLEQAICETNSAGTPVYLVMTGFL